MFNFLRKIRSILVNSGSGQKYILYAIGEILLVMIGILLALQVNNWNEERTKRAQLKLHLQNLKQDLKADQEKFDRSVRINIFRFYSLQHLLELAGQSKVELTEDEAILAFSENGIWEKEIPNEFNREFVQLAFLWSGRRGSSVVQKATVDEMKGTGLFSNLNPELKKALNHYYSEISWRLEADPDPVRIIFQWKALLAAKGLVTTDVINLEDPIDLLKETPGLLGYAKRLIREARWLAFSGHFISQLGHELEHLIDKELDNL